MKLIVSIDQKAAFAAGINAPNSTHTLDLDPAAITDPVLRTWVAEHLDLKSSTVTATQPWPDPSYCSGVYHGSKAAPGVIPPVTPEKVIAALAELHHQAVTAAATIAAQTIAEVRSNLENRCTRNGSDVAHAGGRAANVSYQFPYFSHELGEAEFNTLVAAIPGAREWLDSLDAARVEAKAKAEAEARRREAVCAEEDRQAAATAAAQEQVMREAVATHASDLQKEMHRRGLLDKNLILGWLADEAFTPLAGWPRYTPLTKDDCDFGEHDPECTKVYFRNEKLDQPSEAQFAQVLEAEKLLPGCTTQVCLHVAEDDNDSKVEFTECRYSLDVTVTHKGMTFTRSFAAPE